MSDPGMASTRRGGVDIYHVLSVVAALVGSYMLVDSIIGRITVQANDDVFVYFTYAKNFVLGRPFAYDPRGIPSEGFTSWVYLLLIVPFEYLGMNLMYATVIINVVSIVGCAIMVMVVYAQMVERFSVWALVAGLAFLFFASLDRNLIGMAGWGLSSLVNGLSLLSLLSAAIFVRGNTEKTSRWLLFYALGLLVIFVRPENGALAFALFLWLLYTSRNYLLPIKLALWPIILFALWLAWKYWLFGDVFPTGYYRKMTGAPQSGWNYILRYYQTYTSWIVCSAAFAAGVTDSPFGLRYGCS